MFTPCQKCCCVCVVQALALVQSLALARLVWPLALPLVQVCFQLPCDDSVGLGALLCIRREITPLARCIDRSVLGLLDGYFVPTAHARHGADVRFWFSCQCSPLPFFNDLF